LASIIIDEISRLKKIKQRCIIINFNTKKATFLALLSAIRYTNVPILLFDCKSNDGSFEFFSTLQNRYEFDLISLPLNSHSSTLDFIFSTLNDEEILLLDSDLEILNELIFKFLNKHINHLRIFGSGFLDGPVILSNEIFKSSGLQNAFYFERLFMPIVLFKVNFIKEALKAGISFNPVTIENGISLIPQFLTKNSRQLRIIDESLRLLKKRYLSHYPSKIIYDTGAKIYEYLRYKIFIFLLNLPEPCHSEYVTHYWGVTRNTIDTEDKLTVQFVQNLEIIVSERLKIKYNEYLD
jgi:hypothetical protein